MKNRKLIVLGGSGIGMIAASVAADTGKYEMQGFLNDEIPVGDHIGKFTRLPVLGRTEDISTFLCDPNVDFFIAYVGLQNEQKTYEKISSLAIPIDRLAKLVHPTAIIPGGMTCLGSGVLLAPLSQLSPDTSLSDNCIMLANSFLGHDSSMDRFAHLATNAVVGANVKVGRGVHIGSNSTIREKVSIGDFSLIGAGSVVLKNVPSNSVVVGNPARVLQQR